MWVTPQNHVLTNETRTASTRSKVPLIPLSFPMTTGSIICAAILARLDTEVSRDIVRSVSHALQHAWLRCTRRRGSNRNCSPPTPIPASGTTALGPCLGQPHIGQRRRTARQVIHSLENVGFRFVSLRHHVVVHSEVIGDGLFRRHALQLRAERVVRRWKLAG